MRQGLGAGPDRGCGRWGGTWQEGGAWMGGACQKGGAWWRWGLAGGWGLWGRGLTGGGSCGAGHVRKVEPMGRGLTRVEPVGRGLATGWELVQVEPGMGWSLVGAGHGAQPKV